MPSVPKEPHPFETVKSPSERQWDGGGIEYLGCGGKLQRRPAGWRMNGNLPLRFLLARAITNRGSTVIYGNTFYHSYEKVSRCFLAFCSRDSHLFSFSATASLEREGCPIWQRARR